MFIKNGWKKTELRRLKWPERFQRRLPPTVYQINTFLLSRNVLLVSSICLLSPAMNLYVFRSRMMARVHIWPSSNPKQKLTVSVWAGCLYLRSRFTQAVVRQEEEFAMRLPTAQRQAPSASLPEVGGLNHCPLELIENVGAFQLWFSSSAPLGHPSAIASYRFLLSNLNYWKGCQMGPTCQHYCVWWYHGSWHHHGIAAIVSDSLLFFNSPG